MRVSAESARRVWGRRWVWIPKEVAPPAAPRRSRPPTKNPNPHLREAIGKAEDDHVLRQVRQAMGLRKAVLARVRLGPEGRSTVSGYLAADSGAKAEGRPRSRTATGQRAERDAVRWEARVHALRAQRLRHAEWAASNRYADVQAAQAKLPIRNARDDVLAAIREHRVTVIAADPGSGKSTQVPQMLLHEMLESGEDLTATSIVVTQPRRVSAATIAQRVADELGEPLGSAVGYRFRFGRRPPTAAVGISFETCMTALQRLFDPHSQDASPLRDVSHLIIDDAHGRDVASDLLFACVRQAVVDFPHLKVVLMSAAYEWDALQQYFGSVGIEVAQLNIPGRAYPVRELYLDDVPPEIEAALGPPDRGVDLNGVVRAVRYVCEELVANGTVLVFLAGLEDLQTVAAALQKDDGVECLVLHAQSSDEQRAKVFNSEPASGVRRIVLATNVAESSVTVPSVTAVVNAGREKTLTRGTLENEDFAHIVEEWASQSSQKQRAGRAGRTSDGVCLHLMRRGFATRLPVSALPEIVRTPLVGRSLVAMRLAPALGVRTLRDVCGLCLTPPAAAAVLTAMADLRGMRVVDPDTSSDLTNLGEVLATLPLPPKMGKLLVAACILGCVDSALTVCAMQAGDIRTPSDKKPKDPCDFICADVRFKSWEAGQEDGGLARSDGVYVQNVRRLLALRLLDAGLLSRMPDTDDRNRLVFGDARENRHGHAALPLAVGLAYGPGCWVRKKTRGHKAWLLHRSSTPVHAGAGSAVVRLGGTDVLWWAAASGSMKPTYQGALTLFGLTAVSPLAPLLLDPETPEQLRVSDTSFALVQCWRVYDVLEKDMPAVLKLHRAFHGRVDGVMFAPDVDSRRRAMAASRAAVDCCVALLAGVSVDPPAAASGRAHAAVPSLRRQAAEELSSENSEKEREAAREFFRTTDRVVQARDAESFLIYDPHVDGQAVQMTESEAEQLIAKRVKSKRSRKARRMR